MDNYISVPIFHCTFCICYVVNYRGSIGFGQDSVLSLPGNVGDQDVKDVQVQSSGSLKVLVFCSAVKRPRLTFSFRLLCSVLSGERPKDGVAR